MIATNSTAPISGSLLAQVQKLRADALSKQEFEGLDPDVVGSLIDILDHADNVLMVLADEEERVQANADLSDAGRTKAMVKAVRAAHDKLHMIGQKANDRRQAYEQESIAIHSAPQAASDPLAGALREAQLRQRWQAAPLHEQMRAYETAAQNGWQSTLRAFKDVEAFGEDSRLTDFIHRVDRERFEAKEPKRWARLKTLKYSFEVLQSLAMGIDFRMSSYGEVPSFKGKPTSKIDLVCRIARSLQRNPIIPMRHPNIYQHCSKSGAVHPPGSRSSFPVVGEVLLAWSLFPPLVREMWRR